MASIEKKPTQKQEPEQEFSEYIKKLEELYETEEEKIKYEKYLAYQKSLLELAKENDTPAFRLHNTEVQTTLQKQRKFKEIKKTIFTILLTAAVISLVWTGYNYIDNKIIETAERTVVIDATAVLEDLEITLQSIIITKELQLMHFSLFKAEEGYKYVVVNLELKNIGENLNVFLPISIFNEEKTATLVYSRRRQFKSMLLLILPGDLHGKRIEPQTSTEGFIVFRVEEDALLGNFELSITNAENVIVFNF